MNIILNNQIMMEVLEGAMTALEVKESIRTRIMGPYLMTEMVVCKPKTAPGRHRPNPRSLFEVATMETVNKVEGEEHEVEVAGVVVDAVEDSKRRTR